MAVRGGPEGSGYRAGRGIRSPAVANRGWGMPSEAGPIDGFAITHLSSIINERRLRPGKRHGWAGIAIGSRMGLPTIVDRHGRTAVALNPSARDPLSHVPEVSR